MDFEEYRKYCAPSDRIGVSRTALTFLLASAAAYGRATVEAEYGRADWAGQSAYEAAHLAMIAFPGLRDA